MALNQGRWIANFIMACSLFGLVSCGGGGGGTTSSGTPTAQQSTATVSNGTVTALGSVFVNGHEFDTTSASFVDADTGILNVNSTQNSLLYDSGLLSPTVGMLVAVNSDSNSTNAAPVAREVRVNPLVRGYVDSSDTTKGTITVMGQTIQITSSTGFTDKRSCLTTTPACSPQITGQSNLVSSTTSTSPTYVIVYGYSYTPTGSTQAQIVATMVSAWDESNPIFVNTYATDDGSSAILYPFKVSGTLTVSSNTSGGNTFMIGGETIDLTTTTSCYQNGATTSCNNLANDNNSFVSARGLVAPSNNVFAPNVVTVYSGVGLLNPGGTALQVGQTVEIEGTVSSVSGTNFVVRGITIDGSQLTTGFPIVGSKVEFLGTVAANGTIVASNIQSELSSTFSRTIYSAPITTSVITSGAVATSNCPSTLPAYTLTILGQSVVVDCNTEIADRTATSFSAFNITNFKTYFGSNPYYVVVSSYVDASLVRRATSVSIITAPASGFVSVSGLATSGVTTTTTTSGTTVSSVQVQGVTVDFLLGTKTINSGDYVSAMGAPSSSTNTIDTTVNNGTINVIPQANPSSGDGHEGENLGFRGFEN